MFQALNPESLRVRALSDASKNLCYGANGLAHKPYSLQEKSMDSFIAILSKINSEGSRELIEHLHHFFLDVTELWDSDELVAAYQTVMTLKDSSPTPEHPIFERAREALVVQMQAIIYCYTPESGERSTLATRFSQVTGQTFKDLKPSE